MKKVISILSSIAFLALMLIPVSSPEPANALSHTMVVNNLLITNSENKVFISASGIGVLSMPTSWSVTTASGSGNITLAAYNDQSWVGMIWQEAWRAGSGTETTKLQLYSTGGCGLSTGDVASYANVRKTGAPLVTRSWGFDARKCSNGAYVQMRLSYINSGSRTYDQRSAVSWIIYNPPSASVNDSNFTSQSVVAGTYVQKSRAVSANYTSPFTGLSTNAFTVAPAIGLYCGGSSCSGTATQSGTHYFEQTLQAYGAINRSVIAYGSGIIATGWTGEYLINTTKGFTLTVNPAEASMEQSNLVYDMNPGTSDNQNIIDKETGFVTVLPSWHDAFGNSTSSNIGTVNLISCEGTANPNYSSGTISFASVGTGQCHFRLERNDVFKEYSSPIFQVGNFSQSFSLDSISPNEVDLRKALPTITLSGEGFVNPKVFINGQELSPDDFVKVNASRIEITKLPTLTEGEYNIVIQDTLGMLGGSISYYYLPASKADIMKSTIYFEENIGDSDVEGLIDINSGWVQITPVWIDANDIETNIGIGKVSNCTMQGTASGRIVANIASFTVPGHMTISCALTMSDTSGVATKTITSQTFTISRVNDPLAITQVSPTVFDLQYPEDRAIVIYGSGFITPLHFYVDDQEIFTPNISVYPAGDVIFNVIMPDLPVGIHAIKITTPKGVVTTHVSYINSATSAPAMQAVAYNIVDLGGLNVARKTAIAWIAKEQITIGCQTISTTASLITVKYCPQNPVNRGAMAEFLYKTNATINNTSKTLATPEVDPFRDLSSVSTARIAAIAWLDTQQITTGCNEPGTKYCPAATVNRGAMAEFLFKLAGANKTYTDYTPNFRDISDLSSERIRAINWMGDTGITKGSGSPTTYKPSDPVNRGSMAEFMQRFTEWMKK
jgi:hypothetical protein